MECELKEWPVDTRGRFEHMSLPRQRVSGTNPAWNKVYAQRGSRRVRKAASIILKHHWEMGMPSETATSAMELRFESPKRERKLGQPFAAAHPTQRRCS
jgi:hypothetical protein